MIGMQIEKTRSSREKSTGAPTDTVPRPSTALGTIEIGVWEVLAQVPDPEVPAVSVVDLGIVRSVTARLVTITPTYTGCPATEAIERDIRAALDAAGYRHVRIATVLSPAWTTEWITPEGRAKLLAYGIAPPVPRGAAVACPQCGSSDTAEISRFGSTACKSLWRCRSCAEPFDLFKCH